MKYWRHLWAALIGRAASRIAELEARVAAFEKRSKAGKKAHETRKAKAAPLTSTGASQ